MLNQALVDEALALGFGINLGLKPASAEWNCAIYHGRLRKNVTQRGYACKQGRTPDEALAKCLVEVKTIYEEYTRPISVTTIMSAEELAALFAAIKNET